MKNRMIALIALTAVIGSGAAYGIFAQGTTPPTTPIKHAKGNKNEPHPEMTRARRQLQNAKATLQKANKDFDGHRVKAIGLIDQAVKEIDAGIASDKH